MFFFRYLSNINQEVFIKKLILITIFLSIFALIFSLIALYFGQLNQKKYIEINEIKYHQDLIQEASNKILQNKFNLLRAEKTSLHYILAERKSKLNSPTETQANYCYSLQQSIRISVFDMKFILDLANKYLSKSWKTDHLIDKHNFKNLDSTVSNLHSLFLSKNLPTLCQSKQLLDVKKIHNQQKEFNDNLLYLVKDLKNISKQRLDLAFKQLNENFKNTTIFILIAFVIQLLIFIVINFLDIRSVFASGRRK